MDKGRRQFAAFQELCNFRRTENVTVSLLNLSTSITNLLNRGQILKRICGTVTYRARKIGTYSKNVPNAWFKQ